jgi:hypothetical protein
MNILKKLYGVLSGLIVFIVYLFTLAPSVIQIDSGELAAVQLTLGIAHPTGYPLFTILGYLFTSLPLPFSGIYKTNLLAALWCASAVTVFIYTIKFTLDNLGAFYKSGNKDAKAAKKRKRNQKNQPDIKTVDDRIIPEALKYISAISGGLIAAFSKTFWFQSTSVEVYSLQVFLLTLLIYFIIKAFVYAGEDKKKELVNWLLVAFVLALGFSNHMTTLFILPGSAFLYFSKYKFNLASIKRIGYMLLVFFPILILIYSYLPIRAVQNPLMNWGNPVDVERILRHISGFQYQSWLFSSFDSAKKQLDYFITNFPSEFNIALIAFAVGIISLFMYARKLFVFVLINFLFTILYSINYDINDIDAYFLFAYISAAMFAVFGVLKLFEVLCHHHLHYTMPVIVLAIFIALQGFINFEKVDQSDVYIYEDYTKAVLQTSDKNSIIFSYQWDFFISASYYFRLIEKYRDDICVIDKELIRRSWYPNQIKRTYPNVIKDVQSTIDQFLDALKPFERKEPYDAALLENLYRKIMADLILTNVAKRTYYIAPELFENEMQRGEFALPPGYQLVPDIFFFKVVNSNDYIPAADPNYQIRFPKAKNNYTDFIERVCGSMLVRRALYEMQFDKKERAKVYILKLQSSFPNYPIPKGLAEVIEK